MRKGVEVEIYPSKKVIADTLGTWKITIYLKEIGIESNGGFRLYIPPGWSIPQVERPADLGFTSININSKNGVKLDTYIYSARWIAGEVITGKLIGGDIIEIIYGDTSAGGPGALAPRVAGKDSVFETSLDLNGYYTYEKLPQSPIIHVIPDSLADLEIYVPSYIKNLKVPVHIRAVDRLGNLCPSVSGYVDCKINAKEAENIINLEGGLGKGELSIHTKSERNYFTIKVHEQTQDFNKESNPCKFNDYKILWGDLHGHSNLSDGCFSPEEYFSYAKNVSGLDFASLTDHDNVGFNSNIEEHSKLMTYETWDTLKKVTNNAYIPGSFITIIGYEYTQIELAHGGHRNVYYLDDDPPLFRSWDANTNTTTKLFKALHQFKGRVIVIPHHPRLYMSREHDPEIQRLFEIYSMWGGSETPDDTCAFRNDFKYVPGGLSFKDALSYGYKMGVVAGGDNHDSVPGFSKATDLWRKGKMSRRAGLTAVLVKEKTREEVFDALYNRRCYGTTGDRILLEFEINGVCMGSEITSQQPLIKAGVIGCEKIRDIKLIKNGITIYKVNGSDKEAVLEYKDKSLNTSASYYIRVEQENGEQAWSSPIWVTPQKGVKQ